MDQVVETQEEAVVRKLSALAHPTRLNVFRLVMGESPDGIRAGIIAEAVGVSPSNLTAHLSILMHAGLLTVTQVGRSKLYAANVSGISALLDHLVSECCHGHPDLCQFASRTA